MMKNLFEQSRSHWVRYDHYELKTAEDGKRYITPGKSAKPDVYNPLKEVPGIVLDALNVGMLMMGRRTDESRLRKSTTRATLTTAVPGDLSFVLPHRHLTSIIEALRAFNNVAPGLYSKNTLLYGVEVKFYSSKLAVDQNFETAVENFYAIGDGAGITRGLMQASVTGIVVARDIAKKLGM